MVTIVLAPEAVILDGRVQTGVRITLRDGVISEIDTSTEPREPIRPIPGTLLPGLIDLQCNGAGGRSVDEATRDALDAIAQSVWDGGASAFLPTLITAPFATMLDQVSRVAEWIEGWSGPGARPLGIHAEGPFLETSGTHDANSFVAPTPDRVSALIDAARGHLALVTLAPGCHGAPQAIAQLRAHGVAVALGHGTNTQQFAACVEAGATLVTHLFNAMGPMHHREPGLAGLALDEPRLSCSLIADNVHVHETMLRNAYCCLGPERTILVTDSVAAAGMPDGDYPLSAETVRLADGVVRDEQGRLAGSALTMSLAASNWLAAVKCDAAALATVAASNPARLLARTDLGEIAPGRTAAFCSWHNGRVTPHR